MDIITKHLDHRPDRRTTEEIIILTLCSACLLGLLVFAIIRFYRGDYNIAIVDAIGFICCALVLGYVYTTRNVIGAGIFLSCLSLGGTIAIILMAGATERYLLFPTVLVSYLLVSPRLSLAFTITATGIISISLLTTMDTFDYLRFLLSITGCIFFAYIFASERNKQRDELIKLSTIDGLTGAGNRRALDQQIDEMIQIYQRKKSAMSMLILDLDNFKEINDLAGHAVGDEVLVGVTNSIRDRIRATDHLFRYGGDEFVVLAPDLDIASSSGLADDLRQKIAEFKTSTNQKVSVSIGVAQYIEGDSSGDWLRQTDEALFEAKRRGRNIVHAHDLKEQPEERLD